MREYVSFGAGANSVAMYIYLIRHGKKPGEDFEAVFADPGAEMPETYQYIRQMQHEGFPVTTLHTRRDGLNIYDYYWHYRCTPSRAQRFCTTHWKVLPLHEYFEKPCIVYVGFDADEPHRVHTATGGEGMEYLFPLVADGITRDDCAEIIKTAAWPQPVKSGCYFCPFRTLSQIEEMAEKHPGLLKRCIALEDRAVGRIRDQGKEPGPMVYLGNNGLPIAVAASGPEARRMYRAGKRGQLNFMQDIGLEPCTFCNL